MIRKLLVSSIAAATTMSAVPVLAQTGQQVIEEIQVTSNSRRSEGLADVNAAVSVIGKQELDLVDHTHYQEVLSRVPGYSGNRNNGQESLNAIRSPVLTGSSSCGAFLIAENSIPVRSAGFCNVNEMFDTHSENAQRIELIRGPASAFYGSNAMHGMINVVLPEAGDAGSIGVEAGPDGQYRVKGRYGRDYGNFKQTLMFNGIGGDGYRDDSGVDQQKVSWVYNYMTDNGTEFDGGFTIINLNQETASYITGKDAYEDDDISESNPDPDAFRDSITSRVWTTISREINDWELVATPYFREVNMTFKQHFLPGDPIEDSEHRSLGVQFAAYHELSNGADLALGLDLEDTDGKLKQYQLEPTQGSSFLEATIPQGRHYDYEVEAQQIAAFVNYEQSLGSNWDLSLGLRYETMDYDYDNLMIDGRTDENGVPCGRGGCRYNRPADRSDDFSDFSPKLGLSYTLNDNHTLQLRVQTGFRAPQASELYRLQNSQSVADLDSVELDSFEIAFNGAAADWDYTASIYIMDKDNEIITNSARINLNGAHTRHEGFELGVGYTISPEWAVRGVFNLAKHTYENDLISGGQNINGNDVDTAPNSFGNVRLQWRPTSTFFTELEVAHMGDYYTNPENTASYDGHQLLNLRSQWQVNDKLSMSLNIMNLLDEDYAERADWTSFNGDRYFPGQPVRAYLGVDWDFR